NPNNSIDIDKPRKVYKRTKENEEARRTSVETNTHMKKVS
ncbi:DNA-binding protein, partial [Escherichia coli]|nr:DNA-binding protein [Escherichia coli]MDS1764827.1 DNA-binding protein [Escherichia coli]